MKKQYRLQNTIVANLCRAGFWSNIFYTYQSYDIEIEAIPFKNASRAPATVPEYILHSARYKSHCIKVTGKHIIFARTSNFKNYRTQKGRHFCNGTRWFHKSIKFKYQLISVMVLLPYIYIECLDIFRVATYYSKHLQYHLHKSIKFKYQLISYYCISYRNK